jgi:hypothetical protein
MAVGHIAAGHAVRTGYALEPGADFFGDIFELPAVDRVQGYGGTHRRNDQRKLRKSVHHGLLKEMELSRHRLLSVIR